MRSSLCTALLMTGSQFTEGMMSLGAKHQLESQICHFLTLRSLAHHTPTPSVCTSKMGRIYSPIIQPSFHPHYSTCHLPKSLGCCFLSILLPKCLVLPSFPCFTFLIFTTNIYIPKSIYCLLLHAFELEKNGVTEYTFFCDTVELGQWMGCPCRNEIRVKNVC